MGIRVRTGRRVRMLERLKQTHLCNERIQLVSPSLGLGEGVQGMNRCLSESCFAGLPVPVYSVYLHKDYYHTLKR